LSSLPALRDLVIYVKRFVPELHPSYERRIPLQLMLPGSLTGLTRLSIASDEAVLEVTPPPPGTLWISGTELDPHL